MTAAAAEAVVDLAEKRLALERLYAMLAMTPDVKADKAEGIQMLRDGIAVASERVRKLTH